MRMKQAPFVLSLSKGRSFFFVREEGERCFDKLSTNGENTVRL